MDSESAIPRKSKIDHKSDFKISRMKGEIKATKPHKHDKYHELIYLAEGAGFHTIDLEAYQIKPPSLFLVKAGKIHYWEFTAIPKGFVVIFRSDFLVHLVSSDILSGFKQLQTNFFDLQKSNAKLFRPLFEQMEKEFNHRQEYYSRIIASYLEILMGRMIRISLQSKENPADSRQKLVNNYQQLISKNLTNHHLVKEYADLLNVTPKHLNETCTAATGKTASEILNDNILLEAKRRLLYTSGTVADIGYALGFSDPSNFGTFFKRHASVTPGTFRKEML